MSNVDIDQAGNSLLRLVIVGVAVVIALGIAYTNYSQNLNQMTTSNVGNGIKANFTTNAGNVANTSGTSGNYTYYILFAALVLTVVVGVFAKKQLNG